MSSDTTAYYLLAILGLVFCGFAVGILIAGRMSRRKAADQEWDAAQATANANSPRDRHGSPEIKVSLPDGRLERTVPEAADIMHSGG